MSIRKTQVVICGAGIAGVASAYFLAARESMKDITLLDMNAPLSLTSDQSTECYRNWWPGPGEAMVSLMNRSIDIMEELATSSNNAFHLNRRGYLYCSANAATISKITKEAQAISKLGAGELRVHQNPISQSTYQPSDCEDYLRQPAGADLLLHRELIQHHFPFLSKDICAVLHARRAGWLSAQQLGMYLLERAREHGVRFMNERVIDIEAFGDHDYLVTFSSGKKLRAESFVNAAGPFIHPVAAMLGIELPVRHELHLKVNFKDQGGVLPRNCPMVIFSDPQELEWSTDERRELEEDPDYQFLLGEMPPGVHTRPEGGEGSQVILVLWEYDATAVEPVWPLPIDPFYAEIALRGLEKMIPGIQRYSGRFSKPHVDGGYYTKTPENRPLIGRMNAGGAFIIGALSGYGIMASCAAGELLAKYITGKALPEYAAAFSLERYKQPDYLASLENWGDSGQL